MSNSAVKLKGFSGDTGIAGVDGDTGIQGDTGVAGGSATPWISDIATAGYRLMDDAGTPVESIDPSDRKLYNPSGIEVAKWTDGTGFQARPVIELKSGSMSIPTDAYGQVYVAETDTPTTFDLPALASIANYYSISIIKHIASTVTIKAAGTEVIVNSSAGGTIYNDQATETYATITLLALSDKWVILGAHGTWVTT